MQQLGKYQIHEELGRGGFGAVYRAVDTTLKREVALKVLNPALLHEEGWLARFRREAQVIAALDHPRIVTVHEIAEVNHRAFICMNLLRGPSLDQVLAERGALPWDETRRVMQQVLEALAYAHAKGVLHRDLKPANIVLDAEKGAVLTDFGFARLVGDTSLSLSVSGGLVGSPHYIAPELWHEQPPSPASDLYALGCVLYEMVLDRKAFPGETSPAVMMAHFQPLTLPETWPEGTPPGIADVLRRSLAQEPEARYAKAPDMAEALRAFQVDPHAEPYAALQAAVDKGNWPKALTLAEQLHAQAPDYRDVAALLEQAKAETTRADLIAQWRTQAETALEAGQLRAARAAAEQWRRLAPEDKEVETWLVRIDARTARDARPTPAPPSRSAAPSASQSRSAWWQVIPAWGWMVGALVVVVLLGVGLSALAGDGDATPTATAALAAGDTRTRESDGMTMVYVPAGEFEMGSTEGEDDEEPVHTLALDAFWLDQTEVSVAQFRQFVNVTDHETTAEERGSSWVYTGGGWEEVEGADWAHPQGPASQAEDDHPVVHVSWHDAEAYCAWAGGRLPTEAEWEYAARGPENLIYPWGNGFDGKRLNYCDENCPFDWADENVDDGYARTAPVGSYPEGASWIGALDLSGNVWEWVADWYGDYPAERQENPTGPEDGSYRVLRGGGWNYSVTLYLRGAYRNGIEPVNTIISIGFRCVAGSPGS